VSEKNTINYHFGPYNLEVREREGITLWCGQAEVEGLNPVQREVLLMLVRNYGRTVTRQELYKPLRSIEPQHLDLCIHRLRDKLKQKQQNRPYILVDHGVGYMFAVPVKVTGSPTAANLPSGRLRPNPALLSFDQAKIVIARRGLYSSDWNPAGKGIEHEYDAQVLEEAQALVVVDHVTELMWEKGAFEFSRFSSHPTREERIAELNTRKFAGFDDWRLPTLEEAMSLVTTYEEALATKRAGKETIHLHPVFERTGSHRIWTSDSGIWTILRGQDGKEEYSVQWVVDFLEGRCGLAPSFRQEGVDVKAVRSMSGGS
jgi:DNA-binding winged helix-turn-helix (wHTH) protein